MDDHPLRAWRKDNRVTLAVLAEKVGVTASHLSEIENWNNTPSLELAAKLSRETEGPDRIPAVPLAKFVAQTQAAE